jgi:integrase
MARKPKAPIYWRNGRAYLDARTYADVGGTKEALKPPNETRATRDPIVAKQLAAARIKELEELRRYKHVHGVPLKSLHEYAAYHLQEKAKESGITDTWLDQAERHLTAACEFFGSDRDLASINARETQAYSGWLLQRSNGRGGTLSPGTARQYLNSLSNLYRRAAGEGFVLPGFNPVASLLHKPAAVPKEADWLEVHEAALLLEAAKHYKPKRSDGIPARMLHAIVATYLLSGGREREVLGLEMDDVHFGRKTVTFRPNDSRRLKTLTSHRPVPMWPQLEEILRDYVFGGDGPPPGRLLFPSPRRARKKKGETEAPKPRETMITDLRGALDDVAALVGWKPGEIRTKMFRHTYCSARLQTLDRGAPVSEMVVARELGHGGFELVRRVYGHMGQIRHRSEVVEYRIGQHLEVEGVKERLQKLRAAV